MDSNTEVLMAERENAMKIAAIEDKLKDYERQHQDYEKRLLAIERSSEKTEFQYDEIMKALNKLNDKTIPDLIKDINELKNKPVKRYESIVSAFISGIVAVVVSLIFK